MPQYKSKPILVEAFRLGYGKAPEWFFDMMNQASYEAITDTWTGSKSGIEYLAEMKGLWISYGKNSMLWVDRGDYIYKNQYGHIGAMSRYMFERTHDAV